jgi:sulfatase modifying factor 1
MGRASRSVRSPLMNATIAMMPIRAGRVTLTDRRTQHSWPVDLEPYLLATTPVTAAQYEQVTGHQPSPQPGDRQPVTNVSWWDAVRYCNALSRREKLTPAYRIRSDSDSIDIVAGADGYRLPTEAEWEHACRAGTTGPRYGPLDDIGWYRDNSAERIHDVATRQPNSWGLYDMLGNAWEWCWDIYDAQVYGDYRVLRGGGWFDEHWSCRASVRRRSFPTFDIDDVGFRVARTAVNSPV